MSPPPSGVVGITPVTDVLEPFLGPLAGIVVSVAIFLVIMAAVYVLNKSVFNPLVERILDKQGSTSTHAAR